MERQTLSVLNAYFDQTSALLPYLTDILDLEDRSNNISSHIVQLEDGPSYKDLIKNTYVSTTGTIQAKFKVYEPGMGMHEVSDRFICTARSPNVSSQGDTTSTMPLVFEKQKTFSKFTHQWIPT